MSKGHVFIAQNSDVDYVRQACALALSIKRFNKIENKTCLITNDTVPEEYKHAFDFIIPIPWGDLAAESNWKIENRWKLYYASPYDETIVFDADMLVLDNIEHAWKFVNERDLFFTPLTALELKKYDCAIINPPRNGALPQVEQLAKSNVNKIIYVSCNPNSFARDIKILIESYFKLTNIIAIDQFYNTSHLELVAIFKR